MPEDDILVVTCLECGDDLPLEEAESIDGYYETRFYCSDCFHDNFSRCAACEEVTHIACMGCGLWG